MNDGFWSSWLKLLLLSKLRFRLLKSKEEAVDELLSKKLGWLSFNWLLLLSVSCSGFKDEYWIESEIKKKLRINKIGVIRTL